MPATAKPSASAPSAPASQQEIPGASTGEIVNDQETTDLLLVELGEAPARPGKPAAAPAAPAKPAKAPAAPADDEPDDDADADPEDGAPEGAAPEAGAETDEERQARLAQQEGESDEDYAARLEAEGAETEEERQARLDQQEGESDEDYAARLEAEGVDPASLKPKVSPTLQKRFDQLTAKVHEREGKIAQLESEVARYRGQLAERPVSSVEEEVQAARTPADIAALRSKFEQWEEFALAHPEGAAVPGKDGAEIVYTAEQLRGILVSTRRALRAIPAQERFLGEVAAQDAAAMKAYPAYGDADSPLSKAYAAIVQRAPALARAVPDLRLFVGDAMRGRGLRQKGAGAPALPGKAIVRAATPPSPGRGAPVRGKVAGDPRARARAEADARLEAGGDIDDLAGAIEARI